MCLHMQICQTEWKKLMRLWFSNTGRLLFWQRDDRMRQLEDQLMALFLEISERGAYHDRCMEALDMTAAAQTVADCAMLKLTHNVLTGDNACFYDMRSDSLKHYDVREVQNFDLDILCMDTAQAVIDGDPGALRLAALLNWLQIGADSSRAAAIRYWSILAYTGEFFAMQALAYAYHLEGNEEEAALWQAVHEICLEADRRYTITVPEHLWQRCGEEAGNVAQVILAVRRRCADDNQELLPIPLLLYAIDSDDDVHTKLENLYAPPETYHSMLVRQTKGRNKIRGFGQ